MKVAIWGSYAYNNFGDELMAIQYARHLQRMNVEPVVYRLHEPLAGKYGIATADSADELLRDAVFCVFGGGSLLSGNKPSTGWYAKQKEREYHSFTEALERYDCPLHFLSIGGDGEFGGELAITDYRKRLLSSRVCVDATIRQQEDVALLQTEFGIPGVYYPDVLLTVREFWGIEPAAHDDGKTHIGLNVPSSYAPFARLMQVYHSFGRRDIVLHFIRTVRPSSDGSFFGGELIPDFETDSIRHHSYDDPVETLRFVAGLDLIFSFKLHIGLTAAALDVPFVCIHEKLKSKAFLTTIGAQSAYWGDRSTLWRVANVARACTSADYVDAIADAFHAEADLRREAASSWGHLDTLSQIVARYLGRDQSVETRDNLA